MVRLLRKKEKEEEYNEPISRKTLVERSPSSSEKRRIKKGPVKPWGKKERLLVLIVLSLTIGTSAFLAISSRAWKLPGLPRVKAPSISMPQILKEETIVIEKERVKEREKAEEVISRFRKVTENLSGVYGFYVVDLTTGFSYGVNETEAFEPASLNKLPVMAGMFMQEEKGRLSFSSIYKLRNEDKAMGGSLYGKPEGYELTYRDLIKLMGKESDNTAFVIAKNILGREKINQAIAEIGMVSTDIFAEDQKTTPEDIGIFFEKLWGGDIVRQEYKNELLDYLTDTAYEVWITEGIPSDVRVAHKYGRETHVVNDAGIIYADRPFVLVIMSKGVIKKDADAVFPEIARFVYEAQTR